MNHRTLLIVVLFTMLSGLFSLTQTQSIAQYNDNAILSLDWSPNGQYIAEQTQDGIVVYDQDLNTIGQIQVRSLGNENTVWSPDSTRLAFFHQEQKNYFEIRALQDLQTPIVRLEVFSDGDIAWSPDGTQVVLATILIETPENASIITGYTRIGEGIPILDTQTGTIVHDLPEERLTSARIVAWSPDGRYISGASGGEEILIWDALTGEVAKVLTVPPRASGLIWSPDGSLLAQTYTNGVILWDVDQEEIVRTLLPTTNLGSVGGVLDWQGDVLVSETGDFFGEQQILYFWQASTGEVIRSIDTTGVFVRSVALSPDGSQVALGGLNGNLIVEETAGSAVTSISGLIWQDTDSNGLQTGEETSGIADVTVNLYDATDTQVATTTTASDGTYSFEVEPDTPYTIEVIPPQGFTFTVPDVGADDTIDSDVNVSTGRIEGVTLAVGDNLTDLDAGLVPTSGTLITNIVASDGIVPSI